MNIKESPHIYLDKRRGKFLDEDKCEDRKQLRLWPNLGYMQMELVIVRTVTVFGGGIPPTRALN
jgi:hypothetical protein